MLLGGLTGLITGYLLGERGYGKPLVREYVMTLDLCFGLVGACLAGYLSISAFTAWYASYGASVLGSITVVGAFRLISAIYSPWASYKGMSRAAFIEWHDSLAVKELATWKPSRRESSTRLTENRRP